MPHPAASNERHALSREFAHYIIACMSITASHLVTAAEAAEAWGVSTEQIRRYARAGVLPSVKKAGVWLVPGKHVRALLLGCRPSGGRPLSCCAAWREIFAGGSPLHVDPYRYRNRGAVTRWSGSSDSVRQLLAHPDIVIGGIHAGEIHGALLCPLPDEAQVYLSRSVAAESSSAHPCSALEPDPLGEVVARVIPDEIWPQLVASSVPSSQAPPDWMGESGLYAPVSLTILDLLESPHSRERSAAADLPQGTV